MSLPFPYYRVHTVAHAHARPGGARRARHCGGLVRQFSLLMFIPSVLPIDEPAATCDVRHHADHFVPEKRRRWRRFGREGQEKRVGFSGGKIMIRNIRQGQAI